mmetsp:Transcript_14613/g.25243  ORF Transcript_14613/g.25243 Transcript_14613/m.25243 type:complete len:263 (+) Transcript_14613:49-837(+)
MRRLQSTEDIAFVGAAGNSFLGCVQYQPATCWSLPKSRASARSTRHVLVFSMTTDLKQRDHAQLAFDALQVGLALKKSSDVQQASVAIALLPSENLRAYCVIKGLIPHPDANSPTVRDVSAQLATLAHINHATLVGMVLGRHVLEQAVSHPEFVRSLDGMDDRKRTELLHQITCGDGTEKYYNPSVDRMVATSRYLVSKPSGCCGIARKSDGSFERTKTCVHCPFDYDGTLNRSDMKELQARAPLIMAYRDALVDQTAVLKE